MNEVLSSIRQQISKTNDDPINPEGLKLVKLLLKHGAKAQYTFDDWNKGRTQQQMQFDHSGGGSERQQLRRAVSQPITLAANARSEKLIQLLLDDKADINWIANGGNTPLDIVENWLTQYESTNIFLFLKKN